MSLTLIPTVRSGTGGSRVRTDAGTGSTAAVAARPPHLPQLTSRRAAGLFGDDSGAATAEYAIATMANVEDLQQN